MNEQDRIELLKQVAECAPKEMNAEFSYRPNYLHRVNFRIGFDDHGMMEMDDDDIIDATGIICMLNAMDFLDTPFGPAVLVEVIGSKHLSHDVEPSKAWVCRRMVCPENDSVFTTAEGYGTTRAEAVARAFVKVFGGKKQG